jgi:hypothetical protein
MTFQVPNKHRVRIGKFGSKDALGNNGAFLIPQRGGAMPLRVIASDEGMPGGPAWEHVSVSRPDRCPSWAEMCLVKDLFWSPEDTVVQYHPPKSDYVNNHPYCLHLWRPVGIELPRPPASMVGVPG